MCVGAVLLTPPPAFNLSSTQHFTYIKHTQNVVTPCRDRQNVRSKESNSETGLQLRSNQSCRLQNERAQGPTRRGGALGKSGPHTRRQPSPPTSTCPLAPTRPAWRRPRGTYNIYFALLQARTAHGLDSCCRHTLACNTVTDTLIPYRGGIPAAHDSCPTSHVRVFSLSSSSTSTRSTPPPLE